MTFVADPENGRRVFDPETGYALVKVYRDVPNDEAWFDFFLEGTRFLVKSKVSWSDDHNKATFTVRIKQLEDSFRQRLHPHLYQPSPEELHAVAFPALREALLAHLVRTRGDPRIPRGPLTVDVNFVDPAATSPFAE